MRKDVDIGVPGDVAEVAGEYEKPRRDILTGGINT